MKQATVGRAVARAVVGGMLAGMTLYLCNLVAVTVLAPSIHASAQAFVAPWTGLVMAAGALLGYPLNFNLALHAGLPGLGLVTAALSLALLLIGLWRQGRQFTVAGALLLLLVVQVPLRSVTRGARQRAACHVALDTAFFASAPSEDVTRQARAQCAPLAGRLDPVARERMEALEALQQYAHGNAAAATQRLAALLQPRADAVSLHRVLQGLLAHGQDAVVARFTDRYVSQFTAMDTLPKRRAFARIAIAAHSHLGQWDAALADLTQVDQDVDAAPMQATQRASLLAEDARMRADLQSHRVPSGL